MNAGTIVFAQGTLLDQGSAVTAVFTKSGTKEHVFVNVPEISAEEIVFSVPELVAGYYDIEIIVEGKGKALGSLKIENVEPSEGSLTGTDVTITGFDAEKPIKIEMVKNDDEVIGVCKIEEMDYL